MSWFIWNVLPQKLLVIFSYFSQIFKLCQLKRTIHFRPYSWHFDPLTAVSINYKVNTQWTNAMQFSQFLSIIVFRSNYQRSSSRTKLPSSFQISILWHIGPAGLSPRTMTLLRSPTPRQTDKSSCPPLLTDLSPSTLLLFYCYHYITVRTYWLQLGLNKCSLYGTINVFLNGGFYWFFRA